MQCSAVLCIEFGGHRAVSIVAALVIIETLLWANWFHQARPQFISSGPHWVCQAESTSIRPPKLSIGQYHVVQAIWFREPPKKCDLNLGFFQNRSGPSSPPRIFKILGHFFNLKFWEKFHLPPPVMCYMSRITCHVSHVTCRMSLFSFFFTELKLVGGGSVINGA